MTTTIISKEIGESMNQTATVTETYGPNRSYTRQDAIEDGFLVDILLNLKLNGLFFSDYLGQACFFPRCLDLAGLPG